RRSRARDDFARSRARAVRARWILPLLRVAKGCGRRLARLSQASARARVGAGMSARLVRSRRLESVTAAIGNTPLVRLHSVARSAPDVEVYVKLEFCNPG